MEAAFHHAIVALRRATSVVVCAHVRPDGDAVGSVLGLTLALRENGIAAVPTLADTEPAPSTYAWLPGFGLYVSAADLEPPDVFVALDSPNLDRLGEARALAEAAGSIVVFDHHPDAQEFGTVNVLDPTATAAGELVWRFAGALDAMRSREVALCCYVGLITDSGRFSYDNTTSHALRDGAEMLDAGVDPAETARLVYQNRSKASLEIEARAMSRLTLANGGRVAYSWVTDADFAELGVLPEEAETLPDAIRVVRDIEVAVLLRQHVGEVRANLRAKTGFDVGSVARGFDGGGHRAASGFTFTGTIDELLRVLLPQLPGGSRA